MVEAKSNIRPVKNPCTTWGKNFTALCFHRLCHSRSIRKTEPPRGFNEGSIWKLAGWALGTERAQGAMSNVGGRPL